MEAKQNKAFHSMASRLDNAVNCNYLGSSITTYTIV